jgi:BirA family biotin operon repressor/biotin-[acetyl-CoA-carboxylase] ligase
MSATTVFHWDGFDAMALAERFGLAHVELHAEVDSTLDVAHELAERGAVPGTLVVSDAQRAGRGRLGRSWSSEPGRGVWCTIVERPVDPTILDTLSLRIGLQLAESLDAVAGERVRVKWPNDLVLREGKLAGILVEARWSGALLAWACVGVGVNVLAPPGVEGAAGLPAGARRVDVLRAIVAAVRFAAAHSGNLTRDELERFAQRDALRGRRVTSPSAGTVAGIDATGALVIHTERGSELHRAGTIRLAEVDS